MKECKLLTIYRLNLRSILFSTFLSLVIYISFSINASAATNTSVTEFGAYSNDKIEDTASIQKAIDYQSLKGGGVIFFPKGEYLIDAIDSIVLKNNITLRFEPGAVLKALPNNAENYQVIRIHDVENINILGSVKIIGERDSHLGTSGEWGMGISIRGSNNVVLENVSVYDMWGDGIYIGHTSKQNYSKNIKVVNPILKNNRRQGISIVSVRGLDILNAKISNSNGASPQCGIDIEPSKSSQYLENIRITNLSTENNEGAGLKLYLRNYRNSPNPISIFVDSINKVSDGFVIKDHVGLQGNIEIAGYHYLNNNKSYIAPTVKTVTNFSTSIEGSAPKGTLVIISVGNTVLGKSEMDEEGRFNISIPRQLAGTKIRVRLSDLSSQYLNAKDITVQTENYSDLSNGHWAYNEIMYLAMKNIISGYPDGSFQPNKSVTRAEAAKMLTIALNLPIDEGKSNYRDVTSNHWAKNYIAAVSKAGLFKGHPNGTFAPDDKLTRAEMAKVVSIAYKLEGSKMNYFKDVKTTHWAKEYISKLYENGITTGFPDKTFRPEESTKRSEYSVFLTRSLNKDFR